MATAGVMVNKPLTTNIFAGRDEKYIRKEMKYYPVFLNLEGKKCLVIGAGGVARRKANALLKSGARVEIISPGLNPAFKKLILSRPAGNRVKRNSRIAWRKSAYKKDLLKGAFLVIAATSVKKINSQISQDALKSGILVNVADSAQESNFIVPSSIHKAGLTVSIATEGKAPCLSKRMREDFNKLLVPEYAKFLKILSRIRQDLKQRCANQKLRAKILNHLCTCKS